MGDCKGTSWTFISVKSREPRTTAEKLHFLCSDEIAVLSLLYELFVHTCRTLPPWAMPCETNFRSEPMLQALWQSLTIRSNLRSRFIKFRKKFIEKLLSPISPCSSDSWKGEFYRNEIISVNWTVKKRNWLSHPSPLSSTHFVLLIELHFSIDDNQRDFCCFCSTGHPNTYFLSR